MSFTGITLIAVVAGFFVLLAIVASAATFLYRNRPEREERTYFWDEKQ